MKVSTDAEILRRYIKLVEEAGSFDERIKITCTGNLIYVSINWNGRSFESVEGAEGYVFGYIDGFSDNQSNAKEKLP
jgi:hypothetical protein